MNITQEYLKIFLFTSVLSVTAFGILFSSGQYHTTDLDFESTVSARLVGDMTYLVYSIHNTGETNIISVKASADCCTGISNPKYYPVYPRNDTGLISAMLQLDDDGTTSLGYTMDTFDGTTDGWTYVGQGGYSFSHSTEHGGSITVTENLGSPRYHGFEKIFQGDTITGNIQFDYRTKSDISTGQWTNFRVKIHDGQTNKLLFYDYVVNGGIGDTGWQHYSKNATSDIPADTTSIKVKINMWDGDAMRNDHHALWIDNFVSPFAAPLRNVSDGYKSGDTIHVTFVVKDNLGNTKTVIEPVELE